MTSVALFRRPVTARSAIAWARAHKLEAGGGALMLAAVLGGFGIIAGPAGSLPRIPTAEERALAATPPPAVQPMLVKAIAPQAALQLNAAMPIASGPNPSARPFKAPPVGSTAYNRALDCLTQAVYYEAAREPTDGQRAVAQVVLNRVRHPAYPSSVCGVVYQGSERDTGCQFTFTCDGSLYYAPMRSYWDRAHKVAQEALNGYVYAPVGNATHYHADYVVPYWAATLKKSAVIGLHIFYRWAGGWGLPAAFGQHYSAREADPKILKAASLAAEARDRATPDTPQQAIADAKEDLPPALAKLVDSEIGAKGETRVTMRIPGDAGSKPTPAQIDRVLKSRNLNWGLTGETPKDVEQKPLGKVSAVSAVEAKPVAAENTGSGQP
jgi:spore germination cell wall hydrolase CwlJ-like protein